MNLFVQACNLAISKHNIVPVIDRGVFHNYVQVCNQSIDTSFVSFSPFYKRVEGKGEKRWIKEKTMAQWMNFLRNNSFIN